MTITTRRTLYAVIHAHDVAHGIEQARVALENGADGIALIDQYCGADAVGRIAAKVCLMVKDTKDLLVNILQGDGTLGPGLGRMVGCGVWADSLTPALEVAMRHGHADQLTLLCGFGFKYQAETDLEAGYRLALAEGLSRRPDGWFDLVPMVSGRATGLAPGQVLIRRIRSLIGHRTPLAIASGITAENIGTYLQEATHFLVGTAVEDGQHCIVPAKVQELAAIVAAYNEALPR